MAQNGAEILAVPAPKNPPPVTWRWIMFLAALSQMLVPVVADQTTSNLLAEGATNKAAITPAGYAFTIWGLMCVLCALTAGAVLRFGLGARWEQPVLIDGAIVFVGFSIWLTIAAEQWLWVSVGVFAIMVVALIDILRLLVLRRAELTCPRWVARLATVTFGLYLGWSSVAVFANVAAALVDQGWSATGSTWQITVLAAAVAAARR